MSRIQVQCAVCGKIEYVTPCRAKTYKTCSIKCMGEYNKRRSLKVNKTCPICGKTFKVKKSQAMRRVCCSKKCYNLSLPTRFAGSGNPNYRGRKFNSDGYPKVGKYTQHREIVKEILGVDEIPTSLIVHHKDGERECNDPNNLILLTHKLHTWLHKNVGTFVFKALAKGLLTVDNVLALAPTEEDRAKLQYILNTNCTQQAVVLKQGELLGTPI